MFGHVEGLQSFPTSNHSIRPHFVGCQGIYAEDHGHVPHFFATYSQMIPVPLTATSSSSSGVGEILRILTMTQLLGFDGYG